MFIARKSLFCFFDVRRRNAPNVAEYLRELLGAINIWLLSEPDYSFTARAISISS